MGSMHVGRWFARLAGARNVWRWIALLALALVSFVLSSAPAVSKGAGETLPAAPSIELLEGGGPPSPTPPTTGGAQPAPPDLIQGLVTWTASLTLTNDLLIAPGSVLRLSPGIEVRLAPGVAITVAGSLLAEGTAEQRVRLVNLPGAGRWEGIFGQAGSTIKLTQTDVVAAGAGGTAIAIDAGRELMLLGARVLDGGGQVRAVNTPTVLDSTEMVRNEIPYGAAVDITFDRRQLSGAPIGRTAQLRFNRVADNPGAPGAPALRIANQDATEGVDVTVLGNMISGSQGADLTFIVAGPFKGDVQCNTLRGGTTGLTLQSQETLPTLVPALSVRGNSIERHQPPPDNPTYQRLQIGRGAASDLGLDMRENWWGNASGPFEPGRNPGGRGDSAGVNITFQSWLNAPPSCAPA